MEFANYLRFFLALIFVLSLIGLLAWMGRRLGAFPGIPKRQQGQRRLSTIESLALDGRRRMILVRRDNVEHLILLGATSETVIETGIPAPATDLSPGRLDQSSSMKTPSE